MTEQERLNEELLAAVSGGSAGGWQHCARGSCANYGSYVVYTVAGGDRLAGIAERFGVTIPQIQQWNCLGGSERLRPEQKLTISPAALR